MTKTTDRAREYVLAHPHESKEQQAKATEVSTSTIARIRKELIAEGMIAHSRKTASGAGGQPPGADKLGKPASMKDHTAMLALSGIADASDLVPEDDAEVHRRLLRQCLSFAFNTTLHPDTRMSASQMWAKLRDLGKSSQLGPGMPITFDLGVDRLVDLFRACGPKMVLAAVNKAFDVKETPDGEEAHDQAPPPVGTAETPGAA